MRQQDYETIMSCIQFGAPALAQPLALAFNQVIENSNKYVEVLRLEQEKKLAETKKPSSVDAAKVAK